MEFFFNLLRLQYCKWWSVSDNLKHRQMLTSRILYINIYEGASGWRWYVTIYKIWENYKIYWPVVVATGGNCVNGRVWKYEVLLYPLSHISSNANITTSRLSNTTRFSTFFLSIWLIESYMHCKTLINSNWK